MTRQDFWIAQQVADTKYTSNIQPLFKDAKEIAGKRPNTNTPVEKCGIIIEGQDKWKTVIENASKMSNQDNQANYGGKISNFVKKIIKI